MAWTVRIAKQAEKELKNLPAQDSARILHALEEMKENPWRGDVVRLKNQPAAWRRRVGNYRIFFDIVIKELTVDVVAIMRRTSTTY